MEYSNSNMSTEEMKNSSRVDKEYKLYVNNIPPELNENGIKEVFEQYGKVTGIFYPRNAQWSFITYGIYQSAELAIRELNNKNPLYLKVAFAKERHDSQQEPINNIESKIKENDIATSQDINHDIKFEAGVGRGEPLNCIRKNLEAVQANKYSVNSSLDEASNMIEECGSSFDVNELWTRGTVTVTADGKRQVSNGRGYTYVVPDHTPKVEDYIRKVCTQRNIGIHEYSNDKHDMRNEIRKCHVCPNETMKHCKKCYTYYCSRDCQVNDWPRHQFECQRIPALVEETVDNIWSLQISNTDQNQVSKSTIPSTLIPSQNVQLRRPRVLPAQIENSNSINAHANVHNNIDIASNSISKYENDISTSQTKRTDQLVVNKMNTKDIPQQSRSYNHVNQMRKYHSAAHPSAAHPAPALPSLIHLPTVYPPAQSALGYPTPAHPPPIHPSAAYPITSNPNHQSYNTCNNYRHDKTNKTITSLSRETINHDSNRNEASNIPDISQATQERELNDSRSDNDKRDADKQRSKTFDNIRKEEDFNFYKETYLHKTKFTDVEILDSLDNGEYWISKMEDRDIYANLMRELQNIATKSRNLQPVVGYICAVMYKTSWHRAIITSLNPTKVHLIDMGSTETINQDAEIRDIQDLRKIPKLARKICLTAAERIKHNNLKCGDKISVRMLSTNNDTMIVEVQEQTTDSLLNSSERGSQSNMNNSIENHSVIQLPNILVAVSNLLTHETCNDLKIEGLIQVHEIVRNNVYGISLIPRNFETDFHQIVDVLQVKCDEMKQPADFRPQIGDLVCGRSKHNKDWYRGYVSMLSPDLQIAVVDEARVLPVSEICPYPKEFQNICTFGVICETTTHELQVGDVNQFSIVINEDNLYGNSIKIEIKTVQDAFTAVIKSWNFNGRSSVPAFAELKTESKVCLTSYRNHYFMYARSLSDTEIEYYNHIMQRVADYAKTASCVSEPPPIGKMVISKYRDGNNYRAMVTKTQDDNVTVMYVDFGNLEDTNIKNLRVLSDDLATQRCCAAKIVLKDVSRDITMTKETNEYLLNLSGREVPLKCVFDGIPSKDGVYLTTFRGENVNDKINQLLKQSWKQDNYDDKIVYMMDDLEIAPLGNVGETVQVLILMVPDCGKEYIVCPIDINLMTYVFKVMPKALTEYCESTEYYIPRAHELCIALYREEWYRALCLNPRQSDKTSLVFFVDYGNSESVEHQNIRLMPKDFIKPAATTNICSVVNLAPMDDSGNYSTNVREKISELTPSDSEMTIKIVEIIENGHYKIELPIVRELLIEENLIPSS